MSSRQPNNSPNGPEPKKSNTALIVIIVLAVVTLPVLCICGGAVFMFGYANIQNEQRLFDESTFDVVPMEPSIELVPPVKAVPLPIETVPPVESAPTEEPRSSDEASTK